MIKSKDKVFNRYGLHNIAHAVVFPVDSLRPVGMFGWNGDPVGLLDFRREWLAFLLSPCDYGVPLTFGWMSGAAGW